MQQQLHSQENVSISHTLVGLTLKIYFTKRMLNMRFIKYFIKIPEEDNTRNKVNNSIWRGQRMPDFLLNSPCYFCCSGIS